MAIISLTIPNDKVARIVDAICARYGYQELINGVANTQTKSQFTKEWMIKQLKNAVKEHEQATANATIKTDVDTNLNIT